MASTSASHKNWMSAGSVTPASCNGTAATMSSFTVHHASNAGDGVQAATGTAAGDAAAGAAAAAGVGVTFIATGSCGYVDIICGNGGETEMALLLAARPMRTGGCVMMTLLNAATRPATALSLVCWPYFV